MLDILSPQISTMSSKRKDFHNNGIQKYKEKMAGLDSPPNCPKKYRRETPF
jgi:hypothetical protein